MPVPLRLRKRFIGDEHERARIERDGPRSVEMRPMVGGRPGQNQARVSAHGDVLSVSEPLTITAGALTLEIYPENDPQNQFFEADDDNNRSLVTMVSCQGQRFLFTGDIKEERIRLLLQSDVALSCDWIKMPHHGSWNEALPELLEAASPRFAVICCSDKNPADPETLELLEEMGISCWLTSDGDVTFFCSGEDIYGLQR